MVFFSRRLSERGHRVVRFEFPYMAEQRGSGRRRPPNREPVLRATWDQVIRQLAESSRPGSLVIGGKSMGGRIASMLADEAAIAGLVCLGYPFHPAGKPERLRVQHLSELKTPTLILQGERDSLGNCDEVADYPLSPQIAIHWLKDGDHSFKPRRASGRTEADNWEEAVSSIDGFLHQLGT